MSPGDHSAIEGWLRRRRTTNSEMNGLRPIFRRALVTTVVTVVIGLSAVPTSAQVPVGAYLTTNASVRAYAHWTERRGEVTIYWSLVAIREANTSTWLDPVQQRGEVHFSAMRCEPLRSGGIKCVTIEDRIWTLRPTDFFFDPMMDTAEVSFGRGRRVVWRAHGPYRPEGDVGVRPRPKVDPANFWGYAHGGNYVAVRREANVSGRIGGWNLARAATDVGLLTWQGSWGIADWCVLDRGAICD